VVSPPLNAALGGRSTLVSTMKTTIPMLAMVLVGCTTVGGSDVEASDTMSRWAEFSHFLAMPAIAIADWAENGRWPDRERMNELVEAAEIDVQLCEIDVSDSALESFRIEYAVMDSSNRCSNQFTALARRTNEGEQCFEYSVSSTQSSAYKLGGEIGVSAVCGSDYSSLRLDLTRHLRSLLSERGVPEKRLSEALLEPAE